MHLTIRSAGNDRGKVVEGEGFEPSKAVPSDLQSDPFDRSGTPPSEKLRILDIVFPVVKHYLHLFVSSPGGMRPQRQ